MRKIIGGSHIGRVRQYNQDRYRFRILNDKLGVAVLCDGMGGANGGGTAAEIAVTFAENALENALKGSFLENISETSVNHLFTTIFTGANAQIRERTLDDEDLKGMGTTMILALLVDSTLFVGWVGDSRVYITNPSNEQQLTKDHTVVQIMVDDGEITKEEAATHPKKHFITRAVGVSDMVQHDFAIHSMEKEDIVLLCSDGLYEHLLLGEIHPLLATCLKAESIDSLIELANTNGGYDNITAVIMV